MALPDEEKPTSQKLNEGMARLGVKNDGGGGGLMDTLSKGVKTVKGGIEDMFSQDNVYAPPIDASKAQRQPDSATTTGLVKQGASVGASGQHAYDDAAYGAAQQRAAGTNAAAQGAALAAGQRGQGNQALTAQQNLAAGLQGQSAAAANRAGPAALSDADRARALQFSALTNPGPSAAQTQLNMGADQAMGQALALARSGRNGTNPAAERQAMFQNAATMQNLSGQQSLLRAQEEQQRIQGLGNVGSQALGAAGAQTQAQGLNDQTALGYTNAANQAQALGYNAAQGFGGLANQTQGNAQQYDVALQGAANQQQGLGNQMFLGGAGLEQQYNELAEKARTGDRQAAMDMEKLKVEMAMRANEANAANDQKRDSGGLGMIASAAGALFGMSDERSKTKIRELEGELARTYKALGGPPATQGVPKGGEASPALAARDQGLSRELDTAMAPTYAALSGAPATAGIPKGGDTDLRGAKGYSYEYKDPNQPGAAPGTHVGPMAQDLEKSPATAGTVVDTPQGKMVDTGRLSMVNTSAISDQQREADEQQARIDELEQQVQAMSGDATDRVFGSRQSGPRKTKEYDWSARL